MKIFDTLIITNLPAFYKIKLFNEISRYKSIFVIYVGYQTNGRNKDFFDEKSLFPSVYLNGSILKKCYDIHKLLKNNSYKELIIGGWDHPAMWVALFCSSPKKNSMIVESSVFESEITGPKGIIKKLFCSRIRKAYVPGKAQQSLLEYLRFKGIIKVTHGVGIFNYQDQPAYFEKKDAIRKFLYVGRLTDVKNLPFLLDTFGEFPDLELHIVGFGEQELYLRSIATPNIFFHGSIENKKLSSVYQSMDVLILPSKSEPWGLVVEEAINNGLPVIASDRVGCRYDLVTDEYGIVFKFNDKEDLKNAICKISNLTFYNSLRNNISKFDFEEIEMKQVKAYIE